ncbi:conserved hypothetical protein [Shewanella sediminis HAW-EB3]|uniref:DUF4124 domain-containing protein n=1 Tax=Shewanella sediminis (strain HAW-EB3) TaxID=425104 RepID=A8FVL1_SHESH|nr:DUF4124 domain-containing protein [Shewanella sediminis]ABV36884.1 conserved hypothetical protein [Shewanella sediminis HAW-EB3]
MKKASWYLSVAPIFLLIFSANGIAAENNSANRAAEQHSMSLLQLEGCTPEPQSVQQSSKRGGSQIYTWTDENGQVHFSDNPLQGQKNDAELTHYQDAEYAFVLKVKSTNGYYPPSYKDNVTAAIKKVSEIYEFYLPSSGVPPVTVNLTLANDQAGYQKLQRQYAPALGQSQGFYVTNLNLAAVWYRNDKQAHQTSIHESVHVLNAGLFGLSPRWFNEGLAEYFSRMQMQGSAAKIPSPPWKQILSGTELNLTNLLMASTEQWTASELQRLLYAQSYAFVQYLMSTSKGKQLMKQLLAHLIKTRCEQESDVFSILGQYPGGISQLETDWSAWINHERYRSQSF